MAKQFSRRQATRSIGQKVLIGCEDKYTSTLYFNAIRQSLRLSKERIVVFHPDCTDPLNIVKAVENRREALKSDRSWEREDTAWAVFDGDEHQENNFDNWQQAIALAQRKSIHLSIVNPSFELWYLLHFQDCFAKIHRTITIRQLKSHIDDYDKAICYYDTHLSAHTSTAIERARKIQAQIERDKLDEYSNPCCSKLPDLVEKILDMRSNVSCPHSTVI